MPSRLVRRRPPPHHDPPAASGPPDASVRALRAARTRLRRAVAAGDQDTVRAAVDALVETAVAARLARVTACSIAAAALEEGLAGTRGPRSQRVRDHVARWEAHARTRYEGLVDDAD